MKIAVLGSRGIPNRYGGFEEMAAQVSPMWVAAGHQVVVYTTSDHPERMESYKGVELRYIFNPEGTLGLAGQFIYDLLCLRDTQKEHFDVILQLGYTTSGIWSFLWPVEKTVTNMDGLEHQRAKYSGPLAAFLRWSEKRAAKRSKLLIADNPEIATYLKKYEQPTVTIAYGTEVVERSEAQLEVLEAWSKEQEMELVPGTYALHIGRVQKDNHVHEILEAAKNSGAELVAVGDYSTAYGKLLKDAYSSVDHIHFPGTLYDKTVLNALRSHCKFYVHGHSAGGTNPALLEALGCGCFVLAHGNPFNASVLGGLGGLWNSEEELTTQLGLSPKKELAKKQGEMAQQRMKEHFRWEQIAEQYIQAFERML